MILKGFCLILLLSASGLADDFSRTFVPVPQYNPDFSRDCENEGLHLVYARAVSNSNKADVLHYVVTAGKVGPPTVLMIASTGSDAKLSFNCTDILSKNKTERRQGMKLADGSIVFSAGFLVARLWQYNDTKDQANMTKTPLTVQNQSIWFNYPMENFKWNINLTALKQNKISFTTNSTVETQYLDLPEEDILDDDSSSSNSSTSAPQTTTEKPTTSRPMTTPAPKPDPKDLFSRGGRLSLTIVLRGPESRRSQQPRLFFTGNSTQLDVTLNQLNSAFSGSRYGLTLVHMSSLEAEDAAMEVEETKSIDDEFTPGIFKIVDWNSYPKKKQPTTLHDRAFLQWKPVCYTSSARILSASQQMFSYNSPKTIDHADHIAMENSIAFPWFNPSSSTRNRFEAQVMNISFGQSKDGFYLATNFTEWSSSMGLGKPPTDRVSLLVILVISIGLGVPFVLIVAGFIMVLVRRRSAAAESRSSVYPVIN